MPHQFFSLNQNPLGDRTRLFGLLEESDGTEKETTKKSPVELDNPVGEKVAIGKASNDLSARKKAGENKKQQMENQMKENGSHYDGHQQIGDLEQVK